jgi:hypothetical protein
MEVIRVYLQHRSASLGIRRIDCSRSSISSEQQAHECQELLDVNGARPSLVVISGGNAMHPNGWLSKLTDARLTLRQGKTDQAASQIAPLIEVVLRYLISDNLARFEPQIRAWIAQREQEANTSLIGKPSFFFLTNLFRGNRLFGALEMVTGRPAHVLKTLDLNACRVVRNKVSHGDEVSADEARLLLNTAEHLLAYLGLDVETTREDKPELAPFSFTDRDHCLRLLLRKLWKYPDAGGIYSSWAVKESDTLRGEVGRAAQRPGLGIALFTTELATEVFGIKSQPKIRACVDWGVSRTAASPPYLLVEESLDPITGRITKKSDFRHTLALGILMTRSGTHVNHQRHYLQIALENVCGDGGWPAVLDGKESDLPATAYGVEYIAALSRYNWATTEGITDALRLGQEWLILSTSSDGGWSTGIFAGTSWDHVWSTAYLLPRLLDSQIPTFPEWTQAMSAAGAALLRGAYMADYTDVHLRFRVEARIAAALTRVLQARLLSPLNQDSAESWLHEWERRYLEALKKLPAKECDLATTTFASRALLKGMDYRKVGDNILAELA